MTWPTVTAGYLAVFALIYVVAATACVLAGALRLTAGAEQLGLSLGFAVLFVVVAVAQIGFGVVLGVGARWATTTVAAVTAKSGSLQRPIAWTGARRPTWVSRPPPRSKISLPANRDPARNSGMT